MQFLVADWAPMHTESLQAIEFRCDRCWQLNYAPETDAGKKFSCLHCKSELTIPEATPERLRPADMLNQAPPEEEIDPTTMSDAELMKVIQEENVPLEDRNFLGYDNASLLARFFAAVIDSCFVGLSFGLAIVAVIGAANFGVIDVPEPGDTAHFDLGILAIMGFFPLIAHILQWNLIATRGQTIGKMLCCIRIVNLDGKLPGFVMGVVVRNWVRNLLGFIPFFGLIDILFIFADNRRCIHDLLASTRVVNA